MGRQSKQHKRRINTLLNESANPYLQEFQRVWDWLRSKQRWFDAGGLRGWFAWQYTFFIRLLVIRILSRAIKNEFGFAIPNEAALKRLAQFPKLIEIGAGLGYWAALLRARQVDISGL